MDIEDHTSRFKHQRTGLSRLMKAVKVLDEDYYEYATELAKIRLDTNAFWYKAHQANPHNQREMMLQAMKELHHDILKDWPELADRFPFTQPTYKRYVDPQAERYEANRMRREKRLQEEKEDRQRRLNELPLLNPITYKWDPNEVSLRQIEWLMARKRRILAEGKIPHYLFLFEMGHLASLKKKKIQERKEKGVFKKKRCC
jgi:hypothetical protein